MKILRDLVGFGLMWILVWCTAVYVRSVRSVDSSECGHSIAEQRAESGPRV